MTENGDRGNNLAAQISPSPIQKAVAIDGPSGSGKSTIAKNLAQKLDLLYVDTGAMFRAVAYYWYQVAKVITPQVEIAEDGNIDTLLTSMEMTYSPNSITINNLELTPYLREHAISTL
ncbi:MAG: (d)CMP kinase, partial [Oligoflexia bacterium]|nr:(d)CMP kinase [Oligoflexia bacterium]